mmetsp:Transcript_23799/g.35305  ORF Transcript_23799/g.35305 Transcript_23799/m.35305 type:complete len:89 (-) Transcript_23799:1343-1609(-)
MIDVDMTLTIDKVDPPFRHHGLQGCTIGSTCFIAFTFAASIQSSHGSISWKNTNPTNKYILRWIPAQCKLTPASFMTVKTSGGRNVRI